jgi:hypothetical protein
MSGLGIAITMMAIAVITTAEEHGVESCGKPASTKKSWASKAWAIAADTVNSADSLVAATATPTVQFSKYGCDAASDADVPSAEESTITL